MNGNGLSAAMLPANSHQNSPLYQIQSPLDAVEATIIGVEASLDRGEPNFQAGNSGFKRGHARFEPGHPEREPSLEVGKALIDPTQTDEHQISGSSAMVRTAAS